MIPAVSVAELKANLLIGEWEDLFNPLLTLALMQDPGDWWKQAAGNCLVGLRTNLLSMTKTPHYYSMAPYTRCFYNSVNRLVTNREKKNMDVVRHKQALEIIRQFEPTK